jgi:hypothetical protein
MIVRIMGEGQFRLGSAELDKLNELDNAVVAAVARSDASGFRRTLQAMIDHVKTQGTAVGDADLVTSDIVLPSADLSLDEARGLFTGEGIIPG